MAEHNGRRLLNEKLVLNKLNKKRKKNHNKIVEMTSQPISSWMIYFKSQDYRNVGISPWMTNFKSQDSRNVGN